MAKHKIIPNDHTEPITISSPTPNKSFLKTYRFSLWFFGFFAATIVLIGVIILILSFFVLKVKNPQLTINSLHIDRHLVPGLGASLANPFSLNATLTAEIFIKNPNAASFSFNTSTTDFYYGGEVVGVAYAPEGKVRSRRTLRMNVTVDVLLDKVLMEKNVTGVVLGEGGVNITSFTDISGTVNLLWIYKRNLDILLNCSFTLGILKNSFVTRGCEVDVL